MKVFTETSISMMATADAVNLVFAFAAFAAAIESASESHSPLAVALPQPQLGQVCDGKKIGHCTPECQVCRPGGSTRPAGRRHSWRTMYDGHERGCQHGKAQHRNRPVWTGDRPRNTLKQKRRRARTHSLRTSSPLTDHHDVSLITARISGKLVL